MTEQAISPLRRRMIEDMSIRKLARKTQHDYVQRVKDFAAFLGRSPDTAKSEDVRGFRLHLASSETTALYTRVATNTIREVMSPLDRLTPLMQENNEARGEPPA
jgi:integrase/recombinase XerD